VPGREHTDVLGDPMTVALVGAFALEVRAGISDRQPT
jgi:hypothetical protein